MSRFLRLWLLLSTTLVVATVSISVFWFRHVNLTYDYVVQLAIVPVAQALVLAGTVRRRSQASLGGILRAAVRHPLVTPVLIMDVGLLSSGWLLRAHPIWGLSGSASLHVIWTGTKAIVASVFLYYVARRALDDPESRWPARQAVLVALFATCVLALGLDAFWPWIDRVPAHVLAGRPLLVRWLVGYGALWSACLFVTLAMAETLRSRRPAAAWFLEAAAAAVFGWGIVAALSGYQRQYPVGAWLIASRLGTSIAASFLIIASIVAAVTPEPDGAGRPPSTS